MGQFKLTTGAAFTVKVRVQVIVGWQALVTVNVTVAVPPQADGGPVLLLVNTALHPPEMVASLNQSLYMLVMAGCDWQAISTTLVGQVKTTLSAGATVNVEEHAAELLQSSVAVKLIVVVPPQILGGIAPAIPVRVGGPQLSTAVKLESHELKVLAKEACVGQAARFTAVGQLTVGSTTSFT